MKILYTPYYREKNEYRRKELEQCLLRNLLVFDKVVLVAESCSPSFDSLNVSTYPLDHRPTWSDFIRAVNGTTGEEDINVIANSDIYFEDLKELDNIDFKDVCLALSRWDMPLSDYKKSVKTPTLYDSPDSQDAWVFQGKIQPVYGEFKFGYSGSDNRICYELSKVYQVYNPSQAIKAFHLHTAINNGVKGERVKPPYKTIVATDMKLIPKKKKMNILHIGMRSYEAEYGLCDSLEKLGNYELIEWQKYYSYSNLESNTPERHLELTKEITSKCIDKDLIFMHVQCGAVTAGMLHLVKEVNPKCKIVNFNGDVRETVPKYMYDIGDYCTTLYTNEHDVKEMQAKGYDCRYMNVGFDPKIYKTEGDKVKCAPIVFIGNNYKTNSFPMSKFREDMVHELKKEYSDKFAVYGNGWGNLSSGYLNAQQEAAVLRSCKACINVSHFEYPRYSSDRLHRAMGCGALILNKKFPQEQLDFGYSTMIDWDTIKDLKSWIDTILNPSYGTNINSIGQEFAHKYLTWDYLLKQLIKDLWS